MGTLRERSPGTWELTVAAGRDASTGQYRRVIRTMRTTSKRDAKAALAQLEVEVRAGQVGPSDITMAELFELWLEHLQAKGRSENTLYGYRRYIKRDLLPALGSIRLSKLTVLHLDRFYNTLSKRGLAPATVRQAHALIRAALNQGERWGMIGRNVAKLAAPPSMPQREQTPPSVAEVNALIAAAIEIDPLLGLYVRLAAATGMRRAEACALRWSDLNVEARTLTIERSHVALPGVRINQPTKTRTSRTIILDEATMESLADARPGISAEQGGGYIFSDDNGESPWRPDAVTARWARVRQRAGVSTTIRLHDLRHWQATYLLDAGLPLPTVAARLGHASGLTTIAIYAHRTPTADNLAASTIGAALIG